MSPTIYIKGGALQLRSFAADIFTLLHLLLAHTYKTPKAIARHHEYIDGNSSFRVLFILVFVIIIFTVQDLP